MCQPGSECWGGGGGHHQEAVPTQHYPLSPGPCKYFILCNHSVKLCTVRGCDPYLKMRRVRPREVKEVAREVAKFAQFKWQSQVLISG